MNSSIGDIPYPLAARYDELVKQPVLATDLTQHIHAVDLLARYLAFIHAAKYYELEEHDQRVNHAIERLLASYSLFHYFNVARTIIRYLDDRGNSIHASFKDIFKITCSRLPGNEDVDKKVEDKASGLDFDTKNINLLINTRNFMAHGGAQPNQAVKEALCTGIRIFLGKCFTLPCFTECKLVTQPKSGIMGGHPLVMMGPSSQSFADEPLAHDQGLFLVTGKETIRLDPFMIIKADEQRGRNVVGLFYRQEIDKNERYYTPVEKAENVLVEKTSVHVPWMALKVSRRIPKMIFPRQVHEIVLELENVSQHDMRIAPITETLPDNIESETGEESVLICDEIDLAVKGKRKLRYSVVGGDSESVREFSDEPVIKYEFADRYGEVRVESERRVKVRTLSGPKLSSSYSISLADGGTLEKNTVKLDQELIVQRTIRSLGDEVGEVVFTDHVEGGIVLGKGDNEIRQHFARVDVQEPVRWEYRLVVTDERTLHIKTEVNAPRDTRFCTPDDVILDVEDLPPPRVELRWSSVERQDSGVGRTAVDVRIAARNTGGTRAYDVSFKASVPSSGITLRPHGDENPVVLPREQEHMQGYQIEFDKLCCDTVRFQVQYRSISGVVFRDELEMPLEQIVVDDLNSIPLIGRKKECEHLYDLFKTAGFRFVGIRGQRGAGKCYFITKMLDRLKNAEGVAVEYLKTDCEMSSGIVDCFAHLIEQIVYSEHPSGERNNERIFADYLDRIGLPKKENAHLVQQLEQLLFNRDRAANWSAVATFLRKVIAARGLELLVIHLEHVDELERASGIATTLKALLGLQRDAKDLPIAVAMTGEQPLSRYGIEAAEEIVLREFSEDDCQAFVEAVFVSPPPQPTLKKRIFERTSGIPSNLKSLLQNILDTRGTVLNFKHPQGVCILDERIFNELPTTLRDHERTRAENSRIDKGLLSSIALSEGAFTAEMILEVVKHLNRRIAESEVKAALAKSAEYGWLSTEDDRLYELSGSIVRDALLDVVPDSLARQTHSAYTSIYKREGRSAETMLPHVLKLSDDVLVDKIDLLLEGLRQALGNGDYAFVRLGLTRIESIASGLGPVESMCARLLRSELSFLESGQLDQREIEEALERARKIRPRARRRYFNARIRLLQSRWISSHEGNWQSAIEAASSELRLSLWGRRLRVTDPELEFDYYLNLWHLHYQAGDEFGFKRIDKRVWELLRKKINGVISNENVAKFLSLFLDVHSEFKSDKDRMEKFPQPYTTIAGNRVPLRENLIEIRTRLSVIQESFLGKYLSQPGTLDLRNRMLLGRLYSRAGQGYWRSMPKGEKLVEARRLAKTLSGSALGGGVRPHEDYLFPAEALFRQIGAKNEQAQIQRDIGVTFYDMMRLAQDHGQQQLVQKLYNLGKKWLSSSVGLFRELGSESDVGETLELMARTSYEWANRLASEIEGAIQALEQVMDEPGVWKRTEKLDELGLCLFDLLYREKMYYRAEQALLDQSEIDEVTGLLLSVVAVHRLSEPDVSLGDDNVRSFEDHHNRLAKAIDRKWDEAPEIVRPHLEIEDIEQLVSTLSWDLLSYYLEQDDQQRTLTFLRNNQKHLYSDDAWLTRLRATVPGRIVDLWFYEGTSDDSIVEDFVSLVMPLVDSGTAEEISAVVDRVAAWESERGDSAQHLASYEMRVVLARGFLKLKDDSHARRILESVFRDSSTLILRSRDRAAEIAAKALRVLIELCRGHEDASEFESRTELIVSEYESNEEYDGLLLFLVTLIEEILALHQQERDDWYYEQTRELSRRLKSVQQRSSYLLQVITKLILLYLQLPERTKDAVELMKTQCERLLDEKDYDGLSSYLSFLSDLKSNAGADGPEPDLGSCSLQVEKPGDMTPGSTQGLSINSLTLQICLTIMEAMRHADIYPYQMRGVLYNAAKLIPSTTAWDVAAAIYAKLYDVGVGTQGSDVWAFYISLNAGHKDFGDFPERDALALVMLANHDLENADGTEVEPHYRNYLINAVERNAILARHVGEEVPPAENELVRVYLEFCLNVILVEYIQDLPVILRNVDSIDAAAEVSFIYRFMFGPDEEAPPWRLVERIQKKRDDVIAARNALLDSLIKGIVAESWLDGAAITDSSSIESAINLIRGKTEKLVIRYRRRGADIMKLIQERIHNHSMDEILEEVLRLLKDGRRSIDYTGIVSPPFE